MRTREIFEILTKNYENISVVRTQVGSASQNMSNLSNVIPTISSIHEISNLGIIDSIDIFKNNYPRFYTWSEDNYTGPTSFIESIVRDIDSLTDKILSLIKTLEKTLPMGDGYFVSIKLPDYNNLDELPKFYEKLNFTLSPIVKYFSEEDNLSIYSFENGSKWNEFIFQNEKTLKTIAIFLSAAVPLAVGLTEIQKNKLEMKKTQLEIQQLEKNTSDNSTKNSDLISELDKLFEHKEETLYDEHVNRFLDDLEDNGIAIDPNGRADPELRNTIRKSYKSYTSLVKDGAEFHTLVRGSIEVTEETYKLIEISEHSQKQLIQKNEATEFFQKSKEVKLLDESEHKEDASEKYQ